MQPRAPWQDGRRAWNRLDEWYRETGSVTTIPDKSLAALKDVSLCRQLLAEVELKAVRRALAGGKGWVEISVALRITADEARIRFSELAP